MVSLTPDERRTLRLAALTAAVTTAVTAGVNWFFSEAQRIVQARRERRAAGASAGPDREVRS
jgi:hypothetical protein